MQIFLDAHDYSKFISLLRRHLDPDDDSTNSDGREYEKYNLELVAFCLMDNHFHLLIFQSSEPTAITQLMRSVMTAYTMYFNRRYERSGRLFEGIFKASRVTNDSYLMHLTRYIHMNPRNYLRYKHSSLPYYLGKKAPAWLYPDRINDLTPARYRDFLDSYVSKKAELEFLKNQLADR